MKTLIIKKPPDDAIRDVLTHLFAENRISGVFALTRKRENTYAYSLITKRELLGTIVPTFPLMPMNAGKMISRLTMVKPPSEPIAVLLRPCELRALYELVKLEQATLDNLLFISFVCGGVLSLKVSKDTLDQKAEAYWGKAPVGEVVEGLRESCAMCTAFVPDNADVIVPLIGKNIRQETSFIMNTEKGEEYLAGMSEHYSEQNIQSSEVEMVRGKRTSQKESIFANLKTEECGWNGLIDVFGRCINCHACGSACPICYCTLCYIESAQKDTLPLSWERQLRRDGSLRIPDDTVMYHLTRMLHMGVMCVGCGMCSDVCPTDIPVASIFTKVGQRMQDTVAYVPGKDLQEAMPLAVVDPEDFKEEEPEEE
jgi:formate dehydrogenase subunit beta